MGQWYMFTFGGLNRTHCGRTPNARVVRTLSDAFSMGGLEINPDPMGAKNVRTVDNAAFSAVSIATEPPHSVYSGDSRIPFPNKPAVRGIGIRWPPTKQGQQLTMLQRAAVLGGAFQLAHVPEINRESMWKSGSFAPPDMSLASCTLGGTSFVLNGVGAMREHMDLNQPPYGRAGGRPMSNTTLIQMNTPATPGYRIHGQGMAHAVESPPRLLNQVLG